MLTCTIHNRLVAFVRWSLACWVVERRESNPNPPVDRSHSSSGGVKLVRLPAYGRLLRLDPEEPLGKWQSGGIGVTQTLGVR